LFSWTLIFLPVINHPDIAPLTRLLSFQSMLKNVSFQNKMVVHTGLILQCSLVIWVPQEEYVLFQGNPVVVANFDVCYMCFVSSKLYRGDALPFAHQGA